jgi:Protein of unknown function (DUF2690)
MKIATFVTIVFACMIVNMNISDAKNTGDPQEKGCLQNTQIATSKSVVNKDFNVTLTVEMRLSPKCQTRWVRAYVPSGTRLYFKNKSGKRHVEYTAKVNGWNYSDMDDQNILLQACVQYPGKAGELCTSFK